MRTSNEPFFFLDQKLEILDRSRGLDLDMQCLASDRFDEN
jgi:hypothetical protein